MPTSNRGFSAATLSVGLTFGLLLPAAPAFASDSVDSSDAAAAAVSALPDASMSTAAIAYQTSSASTLATGVAAVAAEEEEEASSDFEFSANVAFTTEYRFRGVNLSNGEFAVQGGFDLGHSSGLYVGTWASNLDEQTVGYGSAELDIYGGWSGDLTDGLGADVGVIYYLYPDAPTAAGDTDYIEFYGSLTGDLGPASLTGGVAYAPKQDSLGNTDNLYVYADLGVGIPDSPVTLTGHVGYTDGFLTFTNDGDAVDWSLGAELAIGPATLGAAYVGVEGDAAADPGRVFTDDAFVVTLSASF